MSTTVERAAEPRVVDPGLLAVIGDASAPRSYRKHVAPPSTLPGRVGMLESVRGLVGVLRHGADYFVAKRDHLGDIYRGMLIDQPVVYLWNPDEIQKILRNEEGAWSAALGWDGVLLSRLQSSDDNLGSLLSLDFERHRDARKLVQSAFTPKAIKGYLDIARPPIEAAVSRWALDRRVAFKPAVRRLLADVANEIFTGFTSAQRDEVDRALTDSWGGVFAISDRAWLSPAIRRARRGFAHLKAMFDYELPRRRQRPGSDLLSQLSLAGDVSGRDDPALVGILLSIMFAAYDTTSLAVTSLAYLLAKYPAWQERLRAEAQRVDARDWAGLPQMEQFEWAWKESLRLMPTTGASPRRALRDVDVLGHRLRAGTFVWLEIGPQGRDPSVWSDVLTFDPERFSPARAKQLPRNVYAPFGGGPHVCIGQQLSTFEARLLFHGLLTRTRFSLVRDVGLRHTYDPIGCVQGQVELNITPL